MPSASSSSRSSAAPAKTRSSKPSSTSGSGKDIDTHKLALRGSSKVVTEFFEYGIHTILFQRGVYGAEEFAAVKKYGLTLMVAAEGGEVKGYVRRMTAQLGRWMARSQVRKLVLVVTSRESGEHVERWEFAVDVVRDGDGHVAGRAGDPAAAPKPDAATQAEIQALFRQITASVSFLPMLDGDCTFNVLVYADADSEVPLEWGDSDAKEVRNAEKVMLRSFSTHSHRVDTVVSYRLGD